MNEMQAERVTHEEEIFFWNIVIPVWPNNDDIIAIDSSIF